MRVLPALGSDRPYPLSAAGHDGFIRPGEKARVTSNVAHAGNPGGASFALPVRR